MLEEEETIQKIINVCRGCKYFNISNDGQCEYYECLNDDRLYEIYGEDVYEDEDGSIFLIAVAYYSYDGKLLHVELEDFDFDFKGCRFKVISNGNKIKSC